MKPIYIPKGKAKEYGDYAINIYTGCPHECFYCFAPSVLRRDRELFHKHIEPRPGIVENTRKQLEREQITGKTIHLCFTCDPYPTGEDDSTTREIITLLKEYGNHVQILTKGNGTRDFDLLDSYDWYGVTIDGSGVIHDVHMSPIEQIKFAHSRKIKTWVSFEPVLNEKRVFDALYTLQGVVDKVKIGKLNYYPSSINWAAFGAEVEKVCQSIGVNYYIKEGLRAEMDKAREAAL